MKRTTYRTVGGSLGFLMEFDKLTVNELGTILIAYQPILRLAWELATYSRPPYERPVCKVVVRSVSSGNSVEVITQFALHIGSFALPSAGNIDWSTVANMAASIVVALLNRRGREERTGDALLRIKSPDGWELELPVSVLAKNDLAERVERFIDQLASHGINVKLRQIPDDTSADEDGDR